MNLGEMISFVRTVRGDNGASKYHTDDEIILFLNQSAMKVAVKTQSNDTFAETNTAIGDERYPLPINFISMRSEIELIDNGIMYQLEKISHDKYHRLYGQNPQSGRPLHYRVETGSVSTLSGAPPGDIWLQPIPDKNTYIIRIPYFRRTSNFTNADLDKQYEVPIPLHRAVCWFAAKELSLSLTDMARVAVCDKAYETEIVDGMEMISLADRAEPFQFERAYGGGKSVWRRRK